ncbi:hypothetical protein HELRODRAFT_76920 [Helobdella robusta]|uniref:Uncharacterized protein n=1 Tax=Helobdella robusta TaxID=6412 RepID=T1G2R4_HELRO|nr:hypothetical protein HELRODRAFT_76920 [Helobdella robusta]ESO06916.1 hypothetical protein HELRODRAFT_76920 [Helobdella robusta]
MEKPSTSTAHLSYVFGLKSNVNNNILFLDDQTIIYPYATQCIIYNLDQKSQKYLTISEKNRGVSALAISPNKRYLAVAERGGADKPLVSIYDLGVLRKRKALIAPNNDPNTVSKEYVNLAFSYDCKYFAAQLGSSDWVLQLWLWEKAKLESSVRVTNAQQTAIAVAFNPLDNSRLSVVGFGHVKFYKFYDGNLKQTTSLKLDNVNYCCQSWLPDDRLVVGSEKGVLLFFEMEEFKHEINVAELVEKDLKFKETLKTEKPRSSSKKLEMDTATDSIAPSINNLSMLSKGFACSLLDGSVHVFDKGDAFVYKRTKEIRMPKISENSFVKRQQLLNSFVVSPNEELLICSTIQNQIYQVALNGSINVEKIERLLFESLTHTFHCNEVQGIDVCPKKSLVASCSNDQSIKIWDYDKNQLEISKEFPFEILSVSMHPSGHYLIAGFSDRLRYLAVLVNDLKIIKEIPVKASYKCSFSNGGHLFAATNGNIISIYSAMLQENVVNFTGHNMKIRNFAWSKDDSKMASCADVIYEWDVLTGRRLGEVITKMVAYNDIAYAPDGKSILVVGSDMKVKEIVDYQITRSIEPINQPITSLVIHNRLLFVSTASGTLGIVRYPLAEGTSCTVYTAHESNITGV